MPRKHRPVIDPDTLTGIHRLIWEHEQATTDRDRVRAARRVSDSFLEAGGCGWCWSELHAHADCTAVRVVTGNNQHG